MEFTVVRGFEQKLLESATRAQEQDNQPWELEALRMLAWLRSQAPASELLEQPQGSARYSLTPDPKGKRGIFHYDTAEVILSGKQFKTMQLLTEAPNTLVDIQTIQREIFDSKPIPEGSYLGLSRALRQKIGDTAIVIIKEKGLVFLPNHINLASN